MTNTELIEYYTNTLILQYRSKPKASAHIAALVDVSMVYELIEDVKNAYNINSDVDIPLAVGVQLDIIGKYLGLERTTFTSTDEDYLFYLRFKIIQNYSNASLKEIDDLFFKFFGTSIFVKDNLDMTIQYYFVTPDINQVSFISNNGLLPKPAAVGINQIIGIPNDPFVVLENQANGFGYGYLTTNPVNKEVNFGNGGRETSTVDYGSGEVNKTVKYSTSAVPATAGGRFSYIIQ